MYVTSTPRLAKDARPPPARTPGRPSALRTCGGLFVNLPFLSACDRLLLFSLLAWEGLGGSKHV